MRRSKLQQKLAAGIWRVRLKKLSAEAIPLPDDPVGLGPRLAIMDYLRERKVPVSPSISEQELRGLYEATWRKQPENQKFVAEEQQRQEDAARAAEAEQLRQSAESEKSRQTERARVEEQEAAQRRTSRSPEYENWRAQRKAYEDAIAARAIRPFGDKEYERIVNLINEDDRKAHQADRDAAARAAAVAASAATPAVDTAAASQPPPAQPPVAEAPSQPAVAEPAPAVTSNVPAAAPASIAEPAQGVSSNVPVSAPQPITEPAQGISTNVPAKKPAPISTPSHSVANAKPKAAPKPIGDPGQSKLSSLRRKLAAATPALTLRRKLAAAMPFTALRRAQRIGGGTKFDFEALRKAHNTGPYQWLAKPTGQPGKQSIVFQGVDTGLPFSKAGLIAVVKAVKAELAARAAKAVKPKPAAKSWRGREERAIRQDEKIMGRPRSGPGQGVLGN